MAAERHEFPRIDGESSEEMAEMLYPKRRRCCCIPYRSSAGRINWWRMVGTTENSEGWWTRGIAVLMKLRQLSEIAAGPKWKTFIRRFNRSKSGANNKKHVKFQYDPLSYSLNFDDGAGQNCDLEEYGSPDFSSRYAAIPVSVKSSLDLSKEAPTFA